MQSFKQWLIESIVFPSPESLNDFLDYAIYVCIKAHHKINPSIQKTRFVELIKILEDIQKKVKSHIVGQPLIDDKFKKQSGSLNKNEYPHQFPTFVSILKILKNLGSNYLIDKQDSIALTSALRNFDLQP